MKVSTTLKIIGLAAVAMLAIAEPTLAATGEDKIQNIGNFFESAARDLWKVCGLVALGLLFMKKYEAMLVFVAGALVCGLFIFANNNVVDVIRAIGNTID